MISRTLSELAELTDAVLVGDAARVVIGPASLVEATAEDVSFLSHPRYRDQLESTCAAAVVVGADVETARDDLALLRCQDPGRAFTLVIEAFAPRIPPLEEGVHPTAVVHPTAELGDGVCVGPLVVIGPGARIGERAALHAQVSVGALVQIGPDSILHPHAVLYPNVTIGARCLIHGSAVIGADGFGFQPADAGWEKVPQFGSVIIGDDVEVGSNSSIDCSRFGATRIGRGTKIDNLVHIAHNVQVGEDCLLLGQVGVAGSTRIGDRVVLAGQVGVGGHVEVGDGARAAGGAGLFRGVGPGEEVIGRPARSLHEYARLMGHLKRLGRVFDDVRDLKRRVGGLEEGGQ